MHGLSTVIIGRSASELFESDHCNYYHANAEGDKQNASSSLSQILVLVLVLNTKSPKWGYHANGLQFSVREVCL